MPEQWNATTSEEDRLPVSPGAARLSQLLDNLIALRLEFANDMNGEQLVTATLGVANLRLVRKSLDRTIGELKRIIDAADPPPARPVATGRVGNQRGRGAG